MSNFSTSPAHPLPVYTLDDLCGVAAQSGALLNVSLQSPLLPKDGVYSTAESAAVAALITAARDLHLAAYGIATGRGLADEEARQDVQDALDAGALVAGHMDETRRKAAT